MPASFAWHFVQKVVFRLQPNTVFNKIMFGMFDMISLGQVVSSTSRKVRFVKLQPQTQHCVNDKYWHHMSTSLYQAEWQPIYEKYYAPKICIYHKFH